MGPFRSQVWVNGWMMGKRVGSLGPQLEVSRTGHNRTVQSLTNKACARPVPRSSRYTGQWHQLDRRVVLVPRGYQGCGAKGTSWTQGDRVSRGQDRLRHGVRVATV